MNLLVKTQLALEAAKGELRQLIESDLETRGETFDADLDVGKNKVTARQREFEAAAMLEPTGNERRSVTLDSEELELRSMIVKANVGKIVEAATGQRSTDGVERELQAHFGHGYRDIPLALLETRAVATFTADSEPAEQRPIIGQVFPTSIMDFAGVDLETVAVGTRTVPVLTTGATVHTPAKSGSAAESTAAFDITQLTPKRVQASFSTTREDMATFPGVGDSLRANLAEAVQSKLDSEVLNRANDGLLQFGTAPSNPSAATAAAAYLASAYGAADGLYAENVGDVRFIVGAGAAGTYQHMGKLTVNTGGSAEISVAEKIMAITGGLRVSSLVPAYASNRQDAVVVKGPARSNTVATMWDAVSIEDVVTDAAKGWVKIYLVTMFDFAVVREDGYVRHRFRTS